MRSFLALGISKLKVQGFQAPYLWQPTSRCFCSPLHRGAYVPTARRFLQRDDWCFIRSHGKSFLEVC